MANGGWIKIFRSILDNDLWRRSDPFDCRSAWIDLLLMANFKDNDVNTTKGTITVKRGEIYTSISCLAKRWRWSPNKVRRYIGILNELGMAQSDGTPNGTTIKLSKYDFYQGEAQTNGIGDGIGDGTSESLVGYGFSQGWRRSDGTTNGIGDGTTNGTANGTQHKKDKNLKNEKNKEYDASCEAPARETKHKYGSYQNVLLKDAELEKLKADFGEDQTQEAVTFLDEYIEMKGYRAKSHYLAIRKWVFNAIKEKRQREQRSGSDNQKQPFEQRDYDFDELEKRLLAN